MFISAEGPLEANIFGTTTPKDQAMNHSTQHCACTGFEEADELKSVLTPSRIFGRSLSLPMDHLSSWSRSDAKRFFDCACVLLSLPLLVPIMLIIALAVRLTSFGPIFFLQERVGLHGRIFTIVKFRTMVHATDKAHRAITTVGNQRFTFVGPFLRRWKLDELPQLLNVLAGHMSLVGPRPKMPEHVHFDLPCRPGITGAATKAFAREEVVLSHVRANRLDAYYHRVVLPAKRWLDVEYMARATFHSDLKLIFESVLHRWDNTAMESALNAVILEAEHRSMLDWASDAAGIAGDFSIGPIRPKGERTNQQEQEQVAIV